ncbi:hypothetical protein TTHERM_01401730, partial (macronuclear) [Tetrahymena thermophila SB210]
IINKIKKYQIQKMDQRNYIFQCQSHKKYNCRLFDYKNLQFCCDRCLIQNQQKSKEQMLLVIDQILNQDQENIGIIDNWPILEDQQLLDQINEILSQQCNKTRLLTELENHLKEIKDIFNQRIDSYIKLLTQNILTIDQQYIQSFYNKISLREEFAELLKEYQNNQDIQNIKKLIKQQNENCKQNTDYLKFAIYQFNQTQKTTQTLQQINSQLLEFLQKISDQLIEKHIDLINSPVEQKNNQLLIYQQNQILRDIINISEFKWENFEEIYNGMQININISPNINSFSQVVKTIFGVKDILDEYRDQNVEEILLTKGYKMKAQDNQNSFERQSQWWIQLNQINQVNYDELQNSFFNRNNKKIKTFTLNKNLPLKNILNLLVINLKQHQKNLQIFKNQAILN